MSKIHTLDFSDLAKLWGLDVSDIASIYGLDFACPEIGVSEGFEETGFELTGWTIDEGGPGPGVIDEDYATSSVTGAPGDWEDQCLQASSPSIWGWCNIERSFPEPNIEYHKFDVIFGTLPIYGHADTHLYSLEISGGSARLIIYLQTDPGDSYFYMDHWFGGNQRGFNAVALDTLYTIEIRHDRVALEWEWKINGILQPNNIDQSAPIESPGTFTNTTKFNKVRIGGTSLNTAFEAFFDNWQWSSCGWIT